MFLYPGDTIVEAVQRSSVLASRVYRAGARRSRGFCGGKHKLVYSENVSLVYIRLENALTLTSIYAEGEEELQEAELHGHSL